MEPEPRIRRHLWWDTHVRVPLSRLRRRTYGKIFYAVGWCLWIVSLPLPLFHFAILKVPMPLPTAYVIVWAVFTAFNPAVSMEMWWRLIPVGYVAGMLSVAFFPAAARHMQHRGSVTWALGTCAGVLIPWIIILMYVVFHIGFAAVGTPVVALANLFLCAGVWLLVPPLWPKEKFTHRLRRWLREL